MNEDLVVNLVSEAIKTAIFLAGPLLVSAMSVGLLVSILQAVTQINESTLTFIPKMATVVIVLSIMAPWMLEVMEEYAINIFGNLGTFIK